VQVELERLLENMPLGLPILLGNRDELSVELSVNLRSDFLVGADGMGSRLLVRFLSSPSNHYK